MKNFLPLTFFLISSLLVCLASGYNEKEDALAEKVEELTEWSFKKPVIRLNLDKFKHYVKSPIKNYSMIVMLTALNPQRQCQICKPANDEYQLVAQSWRYSSQFTNKLFFAMVDFDEASEVFQLLKTQSAPQFLHFPRKGKTKAGDSYDISRTGFAAEQIAKWIADRTEVQIKIFRPPNYSSFLLLIMVVSMVGGLLYVKRNSLEFFFNTTTWSILIIGFILIFISGQMWNQIRGPPLVHRDQKGQIGFFAGGHGYQFIAETYIIAGLYGAVVIGFILMNEAPKFDDVNKRKAFAIIGLAVVMVFFSMALSIFRSKYQGYPYSLLF